MELLALNKTHGLHLNNDSARSLDRSIARSIARSLDRSLDRSIDRSIARSLGRSLDRSLARTLDRLLDRSLDPTAAVAVRGVGGGPRGVVRRMSLFKIKQKHKLLVRKLPACRVVE